MLLQEKHNTLALWGYHFSTSHPLLKPLYSWTWTCERSETQTSPWALPEHSHILQSASGKNILSFLLPLGRKMEIEYEIWEDIKEPTVEGYDRHLWLMITFHLALTFFLGWGTWSWSLTQHICGMTRGSRAGSGHFCTGELWARRSFKRLQDRIHSRKAQQIF